MPRRCDICSHPRRAEIDHRLLTNEPAYLIANELGLSRDSLQRHRTNHLVGKGKAIRTPSGLPPSTPGATVAALPTLAQLVQRLDGLYARIEREFATASGAVQLAILVREARATTESVAKLLGLLDADINVHVDARQQSIILDDMTATVLQSLRDFPEARRAVASALKARAGAASSNVAPDPDAARQRARLNGAPA